MNEAKRWKQVIVLEVVGFMDFSMTDFVATMQAALDDVPQEFVHNTVVDLCTISRNGEELPRLLVHYHREMTPEEVAAFDSLDPEASDGGR